MTHGKGEGLHYLGVSAPLRCGDTKGNSSLRGLPVAQQGRDWLWSERDRQPQMWRGRSQGTAKLETCGERRPVGESHEEYPTVRTDTGT